MAQSEDYFRGIDFEKPWEEEDWERFFAAQERLSRELRVEPAPCRNGHQSGLAFREVLRRFGMDPDDPSAPPREFDASPDPAPSARRFWEEGVEAESLPLFAHARLYAHGVASLVERRFPGLFFKNYKSKTHILLQKILADLELRSRAIPAQIAAGHSLGYRSDRVKGNIVRCRQALMRADECLGLATRLPRRFLPSAEYKCLVSDTVKLRNSLQDWILLLRERFTAGSRP
jgi:hypothetical protein